jgi:predicted molibdopterin-dependent oxidoreductase YjgC
MSTTAITIEELESERAELLPSRETLCRPCGCGCGFVLDVNVAVIVCL